MDKKISRMIFLSQVDPHRAYHPLPDPEFFLLGADSRYRLGKGSVAGESGKGGKPGRTPPNVHVW